MHYNPKLHTIKVHVRSFNMHVHNYYTEIYHCTLSFIHKTFVNIKNCKFPQLQWNFLKQSFQICENKL